MLKDAGVEVVEATDAMAEAMVEDKAKTLEKAEKAKSKGDATVTEKIAAEKERKNGWDLRRATEEYLASLAE